MYKVLISIFLCSCVSLSTHEKSLKRIKELEFETISCQSDIFEFQKLMSKLKEEQFRNTLCKRKVHKCSLKLGEAYEFLHESIE
tara:strand:+ start:768 stop:1019 length:252 start_codon:yes stop_codon:yes gene_type:complete